MQQDLNNEEQHNFHGERQGKGYQKWIRECWWEPCCKWQLLPMISPTDITLPRSPAENDLKLLPCLSNSSTPKRSKNRNGRLPRPLLVLVRLWRNRKRCAVPSLLLLCNTSPKLLALSASKHYFLALAPNNNSSTCSRTNAILKKRETKRRRRRRSSSSSLELTSAESEAKCKKTKEKNFFVKKTMQCSNDNRPRE